MKKIFLTGITTLALCVAFNLHAQNTNGWPIVSPYTASPTTTFNGALGLFSPLNSVALSPASTNAYAVGGTNQVFIGTADSDFIGLQFISVIQTNTSAPFTTNLTGNITLRLAKTVDGVTPETTPSIILVLNSSSNTYSGAIPAFPPASLFTNIDVHGCSGLFITSLEETNLGAYGPTNIVTVKVLNKAVKTWAIPSSATGN